MVGLATVVTPFLVFETPVATGTTAESLANRRGANKAASGAQTPQDRPGHRSGIRCGCDLDPGIPVPGGGHGGT